MTEYAETLLVFYIVFFWHNLFNISEMNTIWFRLFLELILFGIFFTCSNTRLKFYFCIIILLHFILSCFHQMKIWFCNIFWKLSCQMYQTTLSITKWKWIKIVNLKSLFKLFFNYILECIDSLDTFSCIMKILLCITTCWQFISLGCFGFFY